MSSNSSRLLLLCGLTAAAAGCPGSASTLPHQLWIAMNQTEAAIQLVDVQPEPF